MKVGAKNFSPLWISATHPTSPARSPAIAVSLAQAAAYPRVVRPSARAPGYTEALEQWFNSNYLPLMKEKGLEVRDRVKAIVG